MVACIEYIVFFLLGISFGSFICCVVYRLPRNIDIILTRSFCPTCKQKLKPFDLFPLISYLFLHGACRYCKTKIPIIYPIMEFTVGLIFILLYYKFSLSYKFLLIITLAVCLLVAALIDIEFYIIPNSMQIVLLFIGLMYSSYYSIFQYLLSAFMLFFISMTLRFLLTAALNKEALGWGDIKFFFTSGLFIEPNSIPIFLMLSGIFGITTAIMWRITYKKETFPFIPSLSAALFTIILHKIY
ncbi:prepilin peptidase [Candidatus Mesenet endosymbiont of Agriotes lineatus]|uniref:prepilin peptidase n=1 Tax=Candidatus Mesenet endosymbiont of Agriotes lineatus TaxID=3077948 RepID=UPI00397772FF